MSTVPNRQALQPSRHAECVPLSQRQRQMFLFRWVLIAYGLVASNVVVLMLLGVDILVAEAVALAVAFAVAEVARRLAGKSAAYGIASTTGVPGMLTGPYSGPGLVS